MKKPTLNGLIIRTAVVRKPELGFVLACDPKKEEDEVPHVLLTKIKTDIVDQLEYEFNAHTIIMIERPELALIFVSEDGYYAMETQNEVLTGDIFEMSHPKPKKKRLGGIRTLRNIAGKAYTVGFHGMVYRLDKIVDWTRIDDGLPATFNIDAIHGYTDSDIYAVGNNGNLWHFDGKNWQRHELPTNLHLYAVNCAGDGVVYVAGDSGVLMKGNKSIWEIVDHDATEEDIWDLEWFNGKLYVSTLTNLYWLNGDQLEPVSFGKDKPKSFYQLSAAPGVLWSVGEFDIMSFDGQQWSRVV